MSGGGQAVLRAGLPYAITHGSTIALIVPLAAKGIAVNRVGSLLNGPYVIYCFSAGLGKVIVTKFYGAVFR